MTSAVWGGDTILGDSWPVPHCARYCLRVLTNIINSLMNVQCCGICFPVRQPGLSHELQILIGVLKFIAGQGTLRGCVAAWLRGAHCALFSHTPLDSAAAVCGNARGMVMFQFFNVPIL